MITVEKLPTAKGLIEKLVEQSKALYEDIAETVNDRERLLQEAESRERMVDDLSGEVRELREHVRELENKNRRLVDDAVMMESRLADCQTRLDAISVTARRDNVPEPPARGNGPNKNHEAAGKAGLAALQRLADVGVKQNDRPAQ
jgi:chromosome segregation ATPase